MSTDMDVGELIRFGLLAEMELAQKSLEIKGSIPAYSWRLILERFTTNDFRVQEGMSAFLQDCQNLLPAQVLFAPSLSAAQYLGVLKKSTEDRSGQLTHYLYAQRTLAHQSVWASLDKSVIKTLLLHPESSVRLLAVRLAGLGPEPLPELVMPPAYKICAPYYHRAREVLKRTLSR